MQRFALALVLALALAALAASALSALTRHASNTAQNPEKTMPRIAFFLLVCVMGYAILLGAG